MAQSKTLASESSRSRKADVVQQKLDLLMNELKREDVPPHLRDLAQQLQDALDDRQD